MAFTLSWCVAITLALTGLMNINVCAVNMTPWQEAPFFTTSNLKNSSDKYLKRAGLYIIYKWNTRIENLLKDHTKYEFLNIWGIQSKS